MGKRKILIEEIKDDRNKRSVTFTKRRDGLFKKAETACQKFGGLQICIIAFSPGGKPFTFTTNSSSSSSASSVDEIIDTYMSSSSSTTSTSSSTVVVGKRRNRSDDDDVQVIETENKKKKRKTMMNAAAAVVTTTPPPPCSITVEEEKLDEGFLNWDHSKNLDDDSDQTHHHDSDQEEELRNEFFTTMGYGENNEGMVTGESSEFLVEGSNTYSWAPEVELQEIINVEDDDDDDFEYNDETTTMGLIPPPPPPHTTTTTSTSVCNSMSASDVNEEEVGDAIEDDGFTLEEWENILSSSSSPTTVGDSSSVVGNGNSTLWSSTCMNQDVNWWPTQEFLHLLCS